MSSSSATDTRTSTAARWTFVLLALALLPIMVYASFDFGVTWDEKTRHKYGELVLAFLRGQLARSSFVEDGGHLYGGLFDVICAAVEPWFHANRYVVRHVINAAFGWAGIVFCGRLAARWFGTWTGVLAMVLLSTSPRYFADSMNNPKDLPFAALSIAALYYISTVSPKWPYVSWGTALKIVVTLALALNVRAASLIYLGYFGLLVIAYVIAERQRDWRRLADTAVRLTAVSVAVLLLGTTFWPWAQGAPLTRPIQALFDLSHFPWDAGVLFDGRIELATDLPRTYAPWWFLISTPPVVLTGLLLSIPSLRRERKLLPCVFWGLALFPVTLVIVQHSTLYDGIRHLLFVYPIAVVLAAAEWTAWMSGRHRLWIRRSAAGLLVAGLFNVLAFDIRFHPNETVYFNELVGGPRGAFAKYEMDYWGNCVLQATAWSADAARLSHMPITVSGNPWQLIQLDVERFPGLFFTQRRNYFDIRLARGPADAVQALANRSDALHKVTAADGTVLCVVLPGPAFAEVQTRLVLPGTGTKTAAGQ